MNFSFPKLMSLQCTDRQRLLSNSEVKSTKVVCSAQSENCSALLDGNGRVGNTGEYDNWSINKSQPQNGLQGSLH